MAVLNKSGLIPEDPWQVIEDEQDVPNQNGIVSFDRWQRDNEQLVKQGVGVLISGGDDLASLAGDLSSIPLIALEIPKFTDGRCFSYATLLRTRFGYQGEIRAVGQVLIDQLFYMQKVGIDSFALAEGQDSNTALEVLTSFSVSYQPA